MGLFDLRSLRVRLLLLAAASIGLVLAVAAGSLTLLFENHLQRRVAIELDQRWTELAGAIALDDAGAFTVARRLSDPRFEQPLSGTYWQVDLSVGEPLRSRSLWDRTLVIPADAPTNLAYEIEGFEPDSEFYLVTRPVTLESAAGPLTARLSIAIDHAEIDALSAAFSGDLQEAMLFIALALFAGAFLQAHLGLAPLTALRRSIRAIRGGDTTRLGPGFPTEIQPLADDLDRLLDRQDVLVAKARDRAGALAHGFKTPLTILTLEARRLAEAGQTASARLLREQIEAMRRHVERELARARIRGRAVSGSALGTGTRTDVAATVAQLVDLVRRMPYADRLAFTIAVPPDLFAQIDRDDFGEIVGNLLDNARKWATAAVTITGTPVDANAKPGRLRLTIADDGPGFGDPAADPRNADGTGLGLGIVEDILAAYGATLTRERVGAETQVWFEVGLVGVGTEREVGVAA